jgi:hypothetical protein
MVSVTRSCMPSKRRTSLQGAFRGEVVCKSSPGPGASLANQLNFSSERRTFGQVLIWLREHAFSLIKYGVVLYGGFRMRRRFRLLMRA